jgi:hypothetical protein
LQFEINYMFDDQPINNQPVGGAPNNLPMGEPDDIFSGVEPTATEAANEGTGEVLVAPPPPNTALGAGVLKPKTVPTTPVESVPKFTTMPELSEVDKLAGMSQPLGETQNPKEIYRLKEPVLANSLVKTVVIVIFLGILGGGGWWIYNKYLANTFTPVVNPPEVVNTENNGNTSNQDNIVDQNAQNNLDPNIAVPQAGNTDTAGNTDVGTTAQEQGIFFGQPVDSDGDGLDNEAEQKLGTDPNNWDSDNDNLSDGDEVLIWKTNPLNPDTDGDGYKDGEEVKNGYNPLGAGKLFNVPTST